MCYVTLLFFFQAEDGIRDYKVTGVQTCALPISLGGGDQAGAVRADQPGAPLVQERQHAGHVEDGNAFCDTDDQTEPGVGGFVDRRRRHGGGHVDHCDIRLGFAHPVRDGVEHRDYTVEQLATLSRRYPCHDLRAVADHLTGVERAVPAGDPLHEQARVLVDEDAHAFACATARFTASSMSVRAEKPALGRIPIASASFVPVSRMTSGTLIGNCCVAWTMPLATSSPRVMPPKMLKRMAFTLGSAVMIA